MVVGHSFHSTAKPQFDRDPADSTAAIAFATGGAGGGSGCEGLAETGLTTGAFAAVGLVGRL